MRAGLAGCNIIRVAELEGDARADLIDGAEADLDGTHDRLEDEVEGAVVFRRGLAESLRHLRLSRDLAQSEAERKHVRITPLVLARRHGRAKDFAGALVDDLVEAAAD